MRWKALLPSLALACLVLVPLASANEPVLTRQPSNAGAGYTWVESDSLRWTTSQEEQAIHSLPISQVSGSSGSTWVEGDALHYITQGGYEASCVPPYTGSPNSDQGSLWIDSKLHYISQSGEERVLPKTIDSFEDGDVTEYSAYGRRPPGVSASIDAYQGSYSLNFPTGSGTTCVSANQGALQDYQRDSDTTNVRIRADYGSGTPAGGALFEYDSEVDKFSDAGLRNVIVLDFVSDEISLLERQRSSRGTASRRLDSARISFAENRWYTLSVTRKNSGTDVITLYDNKDQAVEATISGSTSDYNNHISFCSSGQDRVWIDDFIRLCTNR